MAYMGLTAIESVQPLVADCSGLTASDWVNVAIAAVAVLTLLLLVWQLVREAIGRRKAQASQVFVILQNWDAAWTRRDANQAVNWKGDAVVAVLNNSDGPVFNVDVRLLSWDRASEQRTESSRWIPVMRPRSEAADILFPDVPKRPDAVIEEQGFKRPELELEFTDANGRRWKRCPDGDLQRVKDPK
jgi:hypothetical protein